MPAAAAPDDTVRLTRGYVRRVHAVEGGWPILFAFNRYCKLRGVPLPQADRTWAALRAGTAVARPVAEAFVAFINAQYRRADDPATVLVPIVRDDRWRSWDSVVASLTEQFRPTPGMFVEPGAAADYARIAAAVTGSAGFLSARPGDGTDAGACRARGEALMRRTTEQYAAWLAAVGAWNRHTVLYSCTRAGRREGVSVMLPLTADAAAALAEGRLDDREITPAHLQSPSKYVFVSAVFPLDPAGGPRARPAAVRAEVDCAMYQAAYLTRGLKPYRPVLLSLAPTPLVRERQKRLGYRPTGANLAGFDVPVVRLCHAADAPPGAKRSPYLAYGLMRLGLRVYALANGRDWRRADRDAAVR